LSHNLGILDALIAQTAVGLNVELATFNTKHYGVVDDLQNLEPDDIPQALRYAAWAADDLLHIPVEMPA